MEQQDLYTVRIAGLKNKSGKQTIANADISFLAAHVLHLETVYTTYDPQELIVRFSHPLDTTAAEDLAHYKLGASSPVSAELCARDCFCQPNHCVKLHFSGLVPGEALDLHVQDIMSETGNALYTGFTGRFALQFDGPYRFTPATTFSLAPDEVMNWGRAGISAEDGLSDGISDTFRRPDRLIDTQITGYFPYGLLPLGEHTLRLRNVESASDDKSHLIEQDITFIIK